jgi:hypothetical protein
VEQPSRLVRPEQEPRRPIPRLCGRRFVGFIYGAKDQPSDLSFAVAGLPSPEPTFRRTPQRCPTHDRGSGASSLREALILYSLAVSDALVSFRKQADQRLSSAFALTQRLGDDFGWTRVSAGQVRVERRVPSSIPCPQGIAQGIFLNWASFSTRYAR